MSVVLGLGRFVQRPALVRMGRAAPLLPALQARLLSAIPPTHDKIDQLVKDSKVVVFMKGVPEAPQCGFSNAVVQIMRMHDVKFTGHNVLADEELRQGIKEYSSWPTIPQVFFDGEFIGGCDILLQMHQSGELVEELSKIGLKSALLADDEK
jgi:monothiol glutaredoxin